MAFGPMLIASVLYGLAVGSFLNVVIVRLPERRSLLRPGSRCPACAAAIAWHDNIPVLSFAALRGRCRACGAAISWRYPCVELLTGAAFASAFLAFGPTVSFVVASALLAALIAVAAIDLEHLIIPDAITLPGILAGLLISVGTGRWLDSLLGAVVGGGLFLAIIVIQPSGMGGGDLKLSAMLGAFLGWKVLLFALLVAVSVGGVVAVGVLATGIRARKDPIPFGPFLALGGATGLFWGKEVVAWYLRGFGG